jgi:hypothetical protein
MIFEPADNFIFQAIPFTPGADMVLFLASLFRFFLSPVRSQIQRIPEESIAFHNTQRPQQEIRQQIPEPTEAQRTRAPIPTSAVPG